jgi:hypothetical protein
MNGKPLGPGPFGLIRGKRFTISDLCLLVLGFAIACWAIRPLIDDLGPSLSSLAGCLYVLSLYTVRLACAAVLCALARHLRVGGDTGPAEWLALAIVLAGPEGYSKRLCDLFGVMLYQISSRPLEIGGATFVFRESSFGILLALAGLFLLLRTRPWLPSRLRTPAEFLLAVLFVWGALPGFLIEAHGVVEILPGELRESLRPMWSAAIIFFVRFLWELLLALPATATVLAWRRSDRAPWNWTEWLGALSGILLLGAWIVSFGAYALALVAAPGVSIGGPQSNLWTKLAAWIGSTVVLLSLERRSNRPQVTQSVLSPGESIPPATGAQ